MDSMMSNQRKALVVATSIVLVAMVFGRSLLEQSIAIDSECISGLTLVVFGFGFSFGGRPMVEDTLRSTFAYRIRGPKHLPEWRIRTSTVFMYVLSLVLIGGGIGMCAR